MNEYIWMGLLLVISLPWITYQCAKLAHYGWLQGKYLFNRDSGRKDDDNGRS